MKGLCVTTNQGDRDHMEDTYDIQYVNVKGRVVKFYAVYDGHSGEGVSKHLADRETGLITFLGKVMREWVSESPSEEKKDLILHLKNKFIEYDLGLLRSGLTNSGSTASLAMLWGTQLYLINLGDSRTIVYSPELKRTIARTIDHKPASPSEAQRIQKAGGQVVNGRVNGILAVSRGFGDFYLKLIRDKGQLQYPGAFSKVSPVPDIDILDLSKVPGRRVHILLGTDGLWDYVDTTRLGGFDEEGNRDWCQGMINQLYQYKRRTGAPLDNITYILDHIGLPGKSD